MSKSLIDALLISAGAVLGANARYWIGLWLVKRWGAAFPYGTLAINLTGSLLLGFFLTLAAGRCLADPRWRLLLAVGFLGAYTTFSTYTYESVSLILDGRVYLGLLNLLGSAVSGAVAVIIGIGLAQLALTALQPLRSGAVLPTPAPRAVLAVPEKEN